MRRIKWLKKNLKFKPHLKKGDKVFEFDKARNHSFKRVPKKMDWIFWMDIDDVVRGAEGLKKIAEWADNAKPKRVDAVFLLSSVIV